MNLIKEEYDPAELPCETFHDMKSSSKVIIKEKQEVLHELSDVSKRTLHKDNGPYSKTELGAKSDFSRTSGEKWYSKTTLDVEL